MRVEDLSNNVNEFQPVAKLLVEGFRATGSASWRSIDEALEEVRESLRPDRISRIALDEQNLVMGWIAGIEEYSGNVWELHPMIVRPDCQGRGIGRMLIADFEQQVAKRGGHTVRLGTDDEDGRTTIGGVDLYPDVLGKLGSIQNIHRHPFEFYLKVGYHLVGVIPDANGFGKPDILMAKRISTKAGGADANT